MGLLQLLNSNSMKRFFFLATFVALLFSCSEDSISEVDPTTDPDPMPEVEPSYEPDHNKEPYFSETVELIGLVFRLAGAPEYSECAVESVANSADNYFAAFKEHEAVELAKRYRKTSFGYDAITGYGIQLVFNEEGRLIFDKDYLEGSNSSFDRWSYNQKYKMLAALNDFYVVSNFLEWFHSLQAEKEMALAAFKANTNLDYEWFDTFYGKKNKLATRIILSFMIGFHNNGVSMKRSDGAHLLSPVIGSFYTYGQGIYFGGNDALLVHEFSHPYCNPLIDANWDSMKSKAEAVYSKVADKMTSQAYGRPQTMMYETLVRACTIRYLISHHGLTANQIEAQIHNEEVRGFVMVRTLVKTLEKREEQADKYSTLASFMPEVIKAINNFDASW